MIRSLSYSISLNKFMDDMYEFRSYFREQPELFYVSEIICKSLISNMDIDFDHPNHPFRLYANSDEIYTNLYDLSQRVMSEIRDIELRSYVHSIFHSREPNHRYLVVLMESFCDFADTIYDDNDSDSDSDISQIQSAASALLEIRGSGGRL